MIAENPRSRKSCRHTGLFPLQKEIVPCILPSNRHATRGTTSESATPTAVLFLAGGYLLGI
jgi:hypothetical protein